MKRLLSTFILTLFIVGCFTLPSFAAGTCVLTQSGTKPGGERMWRQYTCTADNPAGTIAYTVTGFYDFYIYSIETWPGTTAPTDATDLTLIDATTGEDLLGGNGTDAIDATTPKTVIPRSTAMSLNFYHMIKGNMTLTITNNAVAEAIMNVRITGVR